MPKSSGHRVTALSIESMFADKRIERFRLHKIPRSKPIIDDKKNKKQITLINKLLYSNNKQYEYKS